MNSCRETDAVPAGAGPSLPITGAELEAAMLAAIKRGGPLSFDALLKQIEGTTGRWVDDVAAQEILWRAIARGTLQVSRELTLLAA